MSDTPTEYVFLAPFALYAAAIAGIGAAYFQWDIGSLRIRTPRRYQTASLAPGILSLLAGLMAQVGWYFHVRPLAAESPGHPFIADACASALAFAVPVYLAFDQLVRNVLRPGFLRYRDDNARLPR